TSLGASRGPDAAALATTLLARDFEAGLDLVAEVLRRPAFAPEKLERVRRELLAEKASAASRAEDLLIEHFYRAAFAGSPYELPLGGTEETLRAISRDDVVRFHAACYRPDTVALAIVGDLDGARVRAAVERALGDWRAPAGDKNSSLSLSSLPNENRTGNPLPASIPPGRLVLVDKPDQTQAHIRVGAPSLPRSHPGWNALSVANVILGGAGLASRVTDVVRTRNGLAYSAATVLVPRREGGPFAAIAQTKSASAGRAIALMLEELERIRREPVGAEELARAKALFAGALPFRLETNAQKAGALLDGDLHGLGPDHLRRQIAEVERLAPADILAVAREHIRPAAMTVAVVAARAEVETQLAAFATPPAPDPTTPSTEIPA
ncbi:MAG TPA: pitrilysin family protein, partial [Planctomycetota bacterium]|nr:pitrilysin family protein [Planctomycetota bacterium]